MPPQSGAKSRCFLPPDATPFPARRTETQQRSTKMPPRESNEGTADIAASAHDGNASHLLVKLRRATTQHESTPHRGRSKNSPTQRLFHHRDARTTITLNAKSTRNAKPPVPTVHLHCYRQMAGNGRKRPTSLSNLTSNMMTDLTSISHF